MTTGPGPYGVPPQQGWSQPTPAFPTQQGGTPPEPPRRKPRVGLVVLLTLSLLVALGATGGAVYLLERDPHPSVVWTTEPFQDPNKHSLGSVPIVSGTWFTGEAVVQTLPDGLIAYQPEDGRQLWGTALPDDAAITCAASPVTTRNVGIVAYGEKEECTNLAAFDLSSGEVLWKQPIKHGKEGDSAKVELARAGDSVVVNPDGDGKTVVRNVEDGKVAWQPARARGGCEGVGTYHGGERLFRTRACDDGESVRGATEVSQIDPKTGKAQWSTRIGKVESVLSTSPPTFEVHKDETSRLVTLDASGGKVRSDIESPLYYHHSAHVHDGTVYVSGAAEGSKGMLFAYRLSSGKELWRKTVGKSQQFYPLLDREGDRIVQYMDGIGMSPKLLEYDAKGREKVLVNYPEQVGEAAGTHFTPYLHDGQVYVDSGNKTKIFDHNEGNALIVLRMGE